MRKVFGYIMVAALLFAGCTRSDDGKVAISLAAGAASVETRVVDDIVQDALFDNGEQIDVFVTDLTGEVDYDQPKVYTINGTTPVGSVTGNTLTTDPQQFYPRGSISIKAYYPKGFAENSTVGVKTFEVATDQTTVATYKACDLMAASVGSQAPTSNMVNLPFSHKMARVVVYLETMTGFDLTDVASIKLAAKLKMDFDKATFATTLTASGNDITDITLAGAGGRMGVCLVPPQTIDVTSGTTGYLVHVKLNSGTNSDLYYRNAAPLQLVAGNTYLLRLKCSNIVITGYTTAVPVPWSTPGSGDELLGELLKLIEGTSGTDTLPIAPYTSGGSADIEWGANLD